MCQEIYVNDGGAWVECRRPKSCWCPLGSDAYGETDRDKTFRDLGTAIQDAYARAAEKNKDKGEVEITVMFKRW